MNDQQAKANTDAPPRALLGDRRWPLLGRLMRFLSRRRGDRESWTILPGVWLHIYSWGHESFGDGRGWFQPWHVRYFTRRSGGRSWLVWREPDNDHPTPGEQ